MKALILAGGLGSRLRPLTQTGAKQLLPVGNKPIIHYVLEDIQSSGITDVGIIVGNETSLGIQQALQDGSRWGINITYLHQEQPLGLAHCVIVAEQFLREEPFVMYLGDNMIQGGISQLAAGFENSGANAKVILVNVPNPRELGVAEFDDKGALKGLVEKPINPPSSWALTGIYFFDSSILEAVHAIKPSRRNELEITDAIQWLIDHGRMVEYEKHQGWWKDTGQPDDLLEANILILQGLCSSVDDTATVDSDSQLIGEVEIGANTEIQNSVIRGPVVIGEGSIIQDSYIGPSTSLGSHCLVRNSEISCSIIMENAQVLDVSVPIDGSILGHGAVIQRGNRKPNALKLVIGDASNVGLV